MAALDWARCEGDRDGDGYLEYLTLSPQGPKHQGWKDSDNAVVDERGVQVEPPFASCELQGYWFAALQIAALLALSRGRLWTARRLWRQAQRLKRRFNCDFWLEEEGFVAFGLDADKRPVRCLTSNAGHCLATGIVARRNVPRLVERLFSPELFSGWGIRTLAADNPSYNPFSYHLGSVWPVENASILLGLRRYGSTHARSSWRPRCGTSPASGSAAASRSASEGCRGTRGATPAAIRRPTPRRPGTRAPGRSSSSRSSACSRRRRSAS
jgi:glycogen debranching enzyme